MLITFLIFSYLNLRQHLPETVYYGIDVEVGSFFVGIKDIYPEFSQKFFCDKRSPWKFSLAVGTLYFPLFPLLRRYRLENRKCGTLNLVLNNLTEKRYAGMCKNIVRYQLDHYSWASALQFSGLAFHSYSRCCCQQATSHLAEVDLKLRPYIKTYMRYMWHLSHMGVERILCRERGQYWIFPRSDRKHFSRGAKSGEISFYQQLETKIKYFFYSTVLTGKYWISQSGGPSTLAHSSDARGIILLILWPCRDSHNIVELHIYTTCNKVYDKRCSSKHCS